MQEILAFTALAIAVGFIAKKYFWKKKKNSKNNCGSDTDCGCH
ncbi:FeoB-associated Cys-rich membrane protein [Flavobacterium faecale]|nr:FeoB-associated Cys-rich membrane protein [Flavobacterium faecale]